MRNGMCFMYLFILIFFLFLSDRLAFEISSNTKLEKCKSGSQNELTCENRLIITGTIAGGTVDDVGVIKVDRVETPSGFKSIEPWSIYIKKSDVVVEYPLTYVQSAKDYIQEIYKYRWAGKDQFPKPKISWGTGVFAFFLPGMYMLTQLTERTAKLPGDIFVQSNCFDKSELYPLEYITCGMEEVSSDDTLENDKSATRVLEDGKRYYDASEGFCCNCLEGSRPITQVKEGNFRAPDQYCREHEIMEACVAMRTDKNHLTGEEIPNVDIYRIQNPITTYHMNITLSHKDPESHDNHIQHLTLTPTDATGSYMEAGNLKATLIGDYVGSSSPASYGHKYLVYPRNNSPREVSNANTEYCRKNPTDRNKCFEDVMFIDTHQYDRDGLTCNKIGVAWPAFRTGNAGGLASCTATERQHCIRNQPRDIRLADKRKKTLENLIWYDNKPGVDTLLPVYSSQGDDASNKFQVLWSNRHISQMKLELNAESVKWIIHACEARILNAEIKNNNFEALSTKGEVEVEIQNIGETSGFISIGLVDFCELTPGNPVASIPNPDPTITIPETCWATNDIFPVPSQERSLAAGEARMFTFFITAMKNETRAYRAVLRLKDINANVMDEKKIYFSTMPTKKKIGAQEGIIYYNRAAGYSYPVDETRPKKEAPPGTGPCGCNSYWNLPCLAKECFEFGWSFGIIGTIGLLLLLSFFLPCLYPIASILCKVSSSIANLFGGKKFAKKLKKKSRRYDRRHNYVVVHDSSPKKKNRVVSYEANTLPDDDNIR